MNLRTLVWITVITCLVVDYVFSATTTIRPKKKKKTRRKKLNLSKHLSCFECFRDFTLNVPFPAGDLCYNPLIDPDRALEENLVTCPKGSTICQVDIHRLNGVFIALERKCAPACHCICKASGFGLEREICSECSKSVDYVTFDADTQPNKTCTLPPRESGYRSSALSSSASSSKLQTETLTRMMSHRVHHPLDILSLLSSILLVWFFS